MYIQRLQPVSYTHLGIGNYIHYQDDGESFAYKKGGYNAYVFSQNNGRLQIKDAVKNYEKPYKGFYVKICRDGAVSYTHLDVYKRQGAL